MRGVAQIGVVKASKTHQLTAGVRMNPGTRSSAALDVEPEHKWHWSDSVTLVRMNERLDQINRELKLKLSTP